MPIIQITPENIRTKARDLRKHKDNQMATMTRLRNLVYSLNTSWKGAAQNAFVAKFISMDRTYAELTNVLESYAKLLETAANELENTDNSLANSINRIG